MSLSETVAHMALGEGDQELVQHEKGRKCGRGVVGSGLAWGAEGGGEAWVGFLPGGRECFLDGGSTMSRGWEA